MAEDKSGLLFPDAVLEDSDVSQHWFVKFARNKGNRTDQDILRSEVHYYRALQTLGIETVASQGLALEEATKPSLWMQRFDRRVTAQGVERYAVESIYSLANVTTPGSAMDHLDVIRMLAGLWREAGQANQIPDLVADYLRRDLINKILGNSDNHGRNTAIIRGISSFRLAPIYDLRRGHGPMKAFPYDKVAECVERRVMSIGEAFCRALSDIVIAGAPWLFAGARLVERWSTHISSRRFDI